MKTCKLSDEDLVKKCAEWVDKLCKSGGSSWSLSVPVNFEKDPDILLSELIKRYSNMSAGVRCIATERRRQVEVEGYLPCSDDNYVCGELSDAAVCYATRQYYRDFRKNPAFFMMWPWHPDFFKPTPDDRIKELTKAGALITAEIDRLQRINNKNNNL